MLGLVDIRIEGDEAIVDLGRIPRDRIATTVEVRREPGGTVR